MERSSVVSPSSSQSQENPSTFSGHARGHGSFSASTVRSPLASAVNGTPLGMIGRYGNGISNSMSAIDDDFELHAPAPAERPAVHRLSTSGSVQALVVDDDVLFAGLQGGEIVVCFLISGYPGHYGLRFL